MPAQSKKRSKSTQKPYVHRPFQEILNNPYDIFVVTDANWKIEYVNDSFLKRFKLKKKQAAGEIIWSFFDKATSRERKNLARKIVKEKKLARFVDRREEYWSDYVVMPIFDDNKQISKFAILSRDITEFKSYEKKLALSEKKYKILFSNLTSGAAVYRIILDKKGRPKDYVFLEVNEEFEKQTGLRSEEIIGKKVTQVIPGIKKDPFDWIGTYGKVALTGKSISFTNYSASLKKWYRVSAYKIGELKFAAIFSDITDIKSAEENIRQSEERLRRLEDAAFEGVLIHDKGIVLDVNKSFCNMFGYKRSDLIGQNALFLIAPEFREKVRKYVSEEYEKPYEVMCTKKDGTKFNSRINAREIVYDGRKVRVAVIRDITEQKRAERDREEFVKKLALKNKELEDFAYTASHDLRSPLITIKGFTDLLKKSMDEGRYEDAGEYISRVNNASIKMMNLLDGLLEISRIGRTGRPYEICYSGEIVDSVLESLALMINEKKVKVDVKSKLPRVYCDKMAITRVFQNLIENGIKFAREGKNPVISIKAEKKHDQYVFYVKDNGIGIDPKFKDKVFDVFHQLDPNAGGTGIGLAMVKKIIGLHNGNIGVKSQGKGKGTAVYFSLPSYIPPRT